MSDLRTLHDAFAELERRADAAAAGTAPVVRPRRAVRLVPVAATVVAVAGLVAGAVWLVPGDSGTPRRPADRTVHDHGAQPGPRLAG